MITKEEAFREISLFKTTKSYELWKELSHLRFSFSLFQHNFIELEKLISRHDSLAKSGLFLEDSNQGNRSWLLKEISFLLFNFLSAGYSLREYRKEKAKILELRPGSEFFKKIRDNKDDYSSDSLLMFARNFRNFLVHRVDPASFIFSRFESEKLDGMVSQKVFIGYPKDALLEYKPMQKPPAGDYFFESCGDYINVSKFVGLYFMAERNEADIFLLEFLELKKPEFEKMISEMADLTELFQESGGGCWKIPFRDGAIRYCRWLLNKL
jgi:hypothetical protein